METLLNELIPVIQQLWAEAKWLGALGAVLLFGIRAFRLDPIQKKLPAKIRWKAWPQWLKWVAPFAVAFAGAMVWKMGAGLEWGTAVAFALTSACTSILGHEVTRAAGDVADMAKLAKNPTYQPGWLRKAVSPVVPVSKAVPK